MLYVRRIMLLVGAVFLAWRVASSGMSAYYVEFVEYGDTDLVPNALAWDGKQPAAIYRKALGLLEEDPEVAKALLEKAYQKNTSDPRPLLALASVADSEGNNTQADAFVKMAAQLRPADSGVQQQIAGYWALREKTEMAMRHWSLAMDADYAARKRLFPLMLKIAEDPRTRGAFETFAVDPPSWWEGFFATVAARALDVDTVRVLYTLRREVGARPVTESERRVYLERLRKDGQITEAYLVWVNSLNQAELEHLALLYDGGFELKPKNMGFGWYFIKTDRVVANNATTYGVDGQKALHLMFKGRETYFGHVLQRLFLDPGTYRVDGKARTDSLESKGGIKWVVRCGFPKVESLGESERFLGSSEWREFSFEFKVSENCVAQEIRLTSGGSLPDEHKISGGAWFDGMGIRKLTGNADKIGL